MNAANSSSRALTNFRKLAKVLAENFEANALLGNDPQSQVIVVLGSSASDNPPLTPWSRELKDKILDQVGRIFQKEEIFLEEICRVFSSDLGHHLWKRDEMRNAILKVLRVEQICNVACEMLGHTDFTVRKIISEEYRAMGNTREGPPPHLTYELLAHLVMHGFVNHIVTMNFDEMLDTALVNELGPRGFRRIITGHEPPLEAGETNVPKLFKVHGTASSPESLRFTYTDISVLTSAQAKNLDELLERASAAGCGRLNLVSFGYSWQDPDLAHWVLAHLERFRSIFIVRRENKLPKIFARQLKNLQIRPEPRFKVLSMDNLCGGRGKAVPSSLFWWCLVEEVCERLKDEPLIPFSRHLLLGTLLAPSGLPATEKSNSLEQRVRLEILLHLLKSKGMINTFGAPDSPRIRAYFSKLRGDQEKVTVETFLATSGLTEFMQRSPEPEARDTFFAKADSAKRMIGDVSRALALEAPRRIERPIIENGFLAAKKVSREKFIRDQVREIVYAPEIEISREVNVKLQWIFSRPMPLLSFPQFANAIHDTLEFPWTHLLAIVESKLWLDYPWTRDLFNHGSERNIMMILPSFEGLDRWGVGRDLRRKEKDLKVLEAVFELEIPWWNHNRHMFLPIRVDENSAELGPGVFYLREHKSPAVAPVYLEEPRDRAKLLATFMLYSQRSTLPSGSSLRKELKHVVERLLDGGGIDPEMVDLVKKALAAIT